LEEIGDQHYQRGRRGEVLAGRLDIALKMDHLGFERAVAPEAESVAVGIDQVRQGPKLLPLLLIVPVLKASRIGTLAWRLDLDEAD